MNTSLLSFINILKKESWYRWRLVTLLYLLTAIAFLGAGWFWPKVYTSSSLVLVDQQNILSPLMRGTAITTEVTDRARMARQVIFSRKAIEKVLATEEWFGEGISLLTPKEYDRLSLDIQAGSEILNVEPALIEISFKNVDPQKAFVTASLLTEIFINESLQAKREESRSAFEFIDNQVSIYEKKLNRAEEAIKKFRSKNIDSTERAKNNTISRLVELKRELEDSDLEIASQNTILQALEKQLLGEAASEDQKLFQQESPLTERILELETRLEELRVIYQDSYPDLVQLKEQIASLKAQQAQKFVAHQDNSSSPQNIELTGTFALEIKRQILAAKNNLVTLSLKRKQLMGIMERERKILESINSVEAEMAELTRDYTVNQNMYQDLLEQRESARVSMNIDLANQGLTMKLQESASLPVTPQGIRFAHFILAGLVLSFVLPVAVAYVLAVFDQKVRDETIINEELGIPVLGSIYSALSPREQKSNALKLASMLFSVCIVWGMYGYTIFLRISG